MTLQRFTCPSQNFCGYELLGRVVDGIGNFIDGGDHTTITNLLNVERKAPGVITRESVMNLC